MGNAKALDVGWATDVSPTSFSFHIFILTAEAGGAIGLIGKKYGADYFNQGLMYEA